jgi:hypothetical protein
MEGTPGAESLDRESARMSNVWNRQHRSRPSSFAVARSIASGATSTPRTSKPPSASQIELVPVPAPTSSACVGRMRPEVTNSTSRGSGSPVSQGSCPAA